MAKIFTCQIMFILSYFERASQFPFFHFYIEKAQTMQPQPFTYCLTDSLLLYYIILLLFIYFHFILLFLVTKLSHLPESFIIIYHLVCEHYLCIKFPTATNEFICSQIQNFMSPTQ